MPEEFNHKALNLSGKNNIIFIAMSKYMFFFRKHAVKFVLERGFTPISQYGIFDYFLLDTLDRDIIRKANNNLMRVSNELWVFGPISDGVLAEIKLMKEWKKPVKYFKISENRHIQEINKDEAKFEDNLERFRNLL